MKSIYLSLCLLLICQFSFSQESRIDSLSNLITQSEDDTIKVKLMKELSRALKKTDLNKAIDNDKEIRKLAEKIDFREEVALSLNRIGIGYYFLGEYAEALAYWEEAKTEFENNGDAKGVANTLSNMGAICHNQSEYTKAMDLYLQALKIAEEVHDTIRIGTVLQNIGAVHNEMNNPDLAIKAFEKALPLFEAKGYDEGIGVAHLNMGEYYSTKHDFPTAIDHFQMAMQYLGSTAYSPSILRCIGEAKMETLGFAEAFQYLDSSYNVAFKSGDIFELTRSINSIAKAYESKGDIQKSLMFFEKGKSMLLDEDRANYELKISTEGLVRLYSLKGDYKSAFENQKILQSINDSLYNVESDNKIGQLLFNFDLQKKEGEIELLNKESELNNISHQKESEKQQIIIIATILGLLLVAIFLVFAFNRLRLTNKQKLIIEKEKEEADKQRLRAEQSEAFKQQFLANMSHEIRTPMNAVMGMTNLVLDTPLQPKQKDYMQGIKKSSDNLLHIINDILDLSKIEAGKMELEEIDFSLADTIDQIKQTLQHRATDKGLELVTSIKSDVSDVVLGDPVRLNQVLINLTGNAIKFTEKGSVAIEVTNEKEGVQFSIIDTGIGIPKDKLKTVFESFSQANASDTRKFGGTGLGLSISRQLVELMGSTISIESEEGSGTCFSFIVDFKEGSKAQLEQRMALERSVDGSILDGLKILITDDNEYNRIVAKDTLLSKADVVITEAENGQDAIDKLQEMDFDVILLDIQMPVMNGYDTTKHIRNKLDSPKKDTPIIALTASVLRSDLDRCTKAGMNSYIPKPFKTQELITGIAQVLGIELRAAKEVEVKEESQQGPLTDDLNRQITDMKYLTDFCNGDQEKMGKYIALFTSTAPTLIERLKTAQKEEDFETIANQIHGFKTKFIMMGMRETKDLAIELEQLCRDDPKHEKTKEVFDRLLTNIEIGVNELKT